MSLLRSLFRVAVVGATVASAAVAVATGASAQPTPPPPGWVVVADPSGASIALPAAPEKKEEYRDGIAIRFYFVKLPTGGIALAVAGPIPGLDDAAVKEGALDEMLDVIKDSFGADAQLTSRQRLTVDGRSAVDGRVAGVIDGQEAFLAMRSMAAGGHIVGALVSGLRSDEGDLTNLHRQALTTLRLPAPPDPVAESLEERVAERVEAWRWTTELVANLLVYIGLPLLLLVVVLLVRSGRRRRARSGMPTPPGPYPGYWPGPAQPMPGPYQPGPNPPGPYQPGPYQPGPYQPGPYQPGPP